MKKLKKLDSSCTALNKSKSKTSAAAIEEREKFKVINDTFFDISSPDLERKIEIDKKRSKEAKEEDLTFLADQRGARTMFMDKEDKKYTDKVNRINDRKRKLCVKQGTSHELEVPDIVEAGRSGVEIDGRISEEDKVVSEEEDCHKEDKDIKIKVRKSSNPKPDIVQPSLPEDAMKQLALPVARFHVSSRATN